VWVFVGRDVLYRRQALSFVPRPELGAGRFEAIGLPLLSLAGLHVWSRALWRCIDGRLNQPILAETSMPRWPRLALLMVSYVSGQWSTTKIPILLGRPAGPFALAKLNHYGWLTFFSEARVDLCMVFGLMASLSIPG